MTNLIIGIIMLLITTLTGSLGALAFKQAMNKMAKLSFLNILKSLWMWIGLVLYVISAITNIVLLSYMEYSVVFPMTALTYVWTIIISYFIFAEKITFKKVLAMIFIIAGIVIISR